ncbi:hypothetical protein [Desulfovibrio sp. QI0442]
MCPRLVLAVACCCAPLLRARLILLLIVRLIFVDLLPDGRDAGACGQSAALWPQRFPLVLP